MDNGQRGDRSISLEVIMVGQRRNDRVMLVEMKSGRLAIFKYVMIATALEGAEAKFLRFCSLNEYSEITEITARKRVRIRAQIL